MQQLRSLSKNINICRARVSFSQNQIALKAFWRMFRATNPFAAFLRCNVINMHGNNIIWGSSYKQDSNLNSEILHEKITVCAFLCFCLMGSNFISSFGEEDTAC